MPLGRRQARSANAHIVHQAKVNDLVTEFELVNHFGEDCTHPFDALRPFAGELAEQDVVLDRRGSVIAFGIEKFDVLAMLIGESRFKFFPGF